MRRGLCALVICAPLACGETTGATANFSLDENSGFFGAPFPIAHRLRDDLTLDVADFPNRNRNALVGQMLEALDRSPVGFGTSAAVYFSFDAALDESTLPQTVEASTADDASAFIMNIDPQAAPDRSLQRVPLFVKFRPRGESYSPDNLLVLLPRPGVSMEPGRWHAAVVRGAVRDALGQKLGRAPMLEALLSGDAEAPAALKEGFEILRDALDRAEIDLKDVRAATVFKTGDPFFEMHALRDAILARPTPAASGLSSTRDHETFCVVEGRVTVPIFQDGIRPYRSEGGEIRLDASGRPATETDEEIRFALTIPKATMPEAGWPLLFYSAGSGGRHTQFIDRGTFEEQETTPGRGPALYLAASNIAAISLEAPLVGQRHPSESYAGLDFFNPSNVYAFRDNIRQAALDFTTLIKMAKSMTIDPALCPGAGSAPHSFDSARFLFHGHSTGATVGSTVLALEPDISAGLLSGAGGSWLYNLSIKAAPLDIGMLVKSLLELQDDDQPDLFDPVLNLAQTLWESAEPINWAPGWISNSENPKNVLMIEGVIDRFLLPPSVNALAIAGGLELLAPKVEETLLEALSPFALFEVSAPGVDNRTTPTGKVTGLVVQHLPPEGIDGHYVPFENPGAKYQYRCFFDSFVREGRATVPAPGDDPFAACP